MVSDRYRRIGDAQSSFHVWACLHKPMGYSMLRAGRKPSAEATRLVRLTLPVQVDAALERIAKIGLCGRSESEVVAILL